MKQKEIILIDEKLTPFSKFLLETKNPYDYSKKEDNVNNIDLKAYDDWS